MKNIVILVLAAAAFGGWGMVVYQNNLEESRQQRIRDAVFSELEYRNHLQESLQQQIDAKKQDRALVVMQEYVHELEGDLDAKLQEFRRQQESADEESREGVQSVLKGYQEEFEKYRGAQVDLGMDLAGYKKQLAGYLQRLDAYDGRLAGLSESQSVGKEEVLALRRSQQRLQKDLEEYSRQLALYQEQLKQYRRQLIEEKTASPVSNPS